MLTLRKTVYMMGCCILLMGCSKNEKFDNYDQIAQKTWKLKLVMNEQGDTLTRPCEIDHELTFYEKEFELKDVDEQCSDKSSIRDKWKFYNEGQSIQAESFYEYSGGTFVSEVKYYDIIEITDTNLTLKDTDFGITTYYEND